VIRKLSLYDNLEGSRSLLPECDHWIYSRSAARRQVTGKQSNPAIANVARRKVTESVEVNAKEQIQH
jgi:hypothetical protein